QRLNVFRVYDSIFPGSRLSAIDACSSAQEPEVVRLCVLDQRRKAHGATAGIPDPDLSVIAQIARTEAVMNDDRYLRSRRRFAFQDLRDQEIRMIFPTLPVRGPLVHDF